MANAMKAGDRYEPFAEAFERHARAWGELWFFCQAGDGIRDGHVTGVQTCALPISARSARTLLLPWAIFANGPQWTKAGRRSEERRVGKECRSRWSPDQSKKKK